MLEPPPAAVRIALLKHFLFKGASASAATAGAPALGADPSSTFDPVDAALAVMTPRVLLDGERLIPAPAAGDGGGDHGSPSSAPDAYAGTCYVLTEGRLGSSTSADVLPGGGCVNALALVGVGPAAGAAAGGSSADQDALGYVSKGRSVVWGLHVSDFRSVSGGQLLILLASESNQTEVIGIDGESLDDFALHNLDSHENCLSPSASKTRPTATISLHDACLSTLQPRFKI